jgi:uncharacterized protein YdeI (YjbR/CyaY-like superfamily)
MPGLDRRSDAASRRLLLSAALYPRAARSSWSKRNVGIIERLLGEGRMRPFGLAAVERAKADGRWEVAYAGQGSIEVPHDLAVALPADRQACAMFEILTSQNRYAVLLRIDSAKRADTRARRIQHSVAMLARGETVYPQRRTLVIERRDSARPTREPRSH